MPLQHSYLLLWHGPFEHSSHALWKWIFLDGLTSTGVVPSPVRYQALILQSCYFLGGRRSLIGSNCWILEGFLWKPLCLFVSLLSAPVTLLFLESEILYPMILLGSAFISPPYLGPRNPLKSVHSQGSSWLIPSPRCYCPSLWDVRFSKQTSVSCRLFIVTAHDVAHVEELIWPLFHLDQKWES